MAVSLCRNTVTVLFGLHTLIKTPKIGVYFKHITFVSKENGKTSTQHMSVG